ncbi:hypothetical protein FHW84_002478 [Dyella sp. SG562]|uniref:zeta toxin family protein n=1 Tax=Dyella sp. SG562 TaxID=2587017 RepID=UPI001422CF64|nr:zeta toxin family protein [Dyella sp. SG562]NII73905.1 hypothetical protein [Dyella sp. SG562]
MSDLTPSQQAAYDRLYGDNPEPIQESIKPGVFTGWYKGAAGIPGGATGAVLGIGSAATEGQVNPDDGLFSPKDILNPIIHPSIEQIRQSAADYYRPDPQTTGWVGNTLYGVGDVLTRVAVGNVIAPGAGLPIAAGTSGFERAKDLESQGVDPATAAESGGITGASLLASGGLSSFGTSTISRVLSGAGLNVAFGASARGLDSAVLRAHGYEAQAAQQEWNDSSSLVADAVIGGAFHLLPHARETPKPSADEIDSALATKNNQNVIDAAPGVPADPAAAGAHVDAMDLAHDQLTDGQPVDVGPVVRDANFVPRPEPAPRTMAEVGTVIDNRLAALDEVAQGVRSKGDLSDLGSEAADLEDLLRQQYHARDNNITQAPENQLTPDELSFAENRLAEIRAQMESHRQAIAARNNAARLREKLAKTDSDPELRGIAESIAPSSTAEARASDIMRSGLQEAGIPAAEIDAAAKPTDDQVTAKFNRKLEDHPAAVSEYVNLPDSMGGRVLNTDIARELSPDYLADRTRSAPVHEPASDFVKRLYAEKLAQPTPEGMDPIVQFTAGGTGAGKTTGLGEALAKSGENPEIIYDTNMNTLGSAEQKVQQALDAGRKVKILYTYREPVDALVNGALPRAERQSGTFGSGRTVPVAEHAKTHTGVRGVIDALAAKYKDDDRVQIEVYDNSHGRGNGRLAALEDIPRIDENGLHERLNAALEEEHRAGRISDQTRAGFRAAGRESVGAGLRGESEPQGSPGARERPGNAAAGSQGEKNAGGMAGDTAAGNTQARPRSSEVNPARGADQTTTAGEAGTNRRAGEAGRADANGDAAAKSQAGLDPARVADVERARTIAEQSPDVQLDDGTTAADAMRAADDEVRQAEQTGSAIQAAVACFLRFGSDL